MSRTAQAFRVLSARLGFYRPVYAHYGVTHRCNMRCRMCDVWKTGDAETELQLPQIERLAANLKKAGVRSVALGGGEPFVRKDLEGIVRAFAWRGFEVRLLTNGIALAPDRIARVISAGVRHASVSLDSMDAKRRCYGGKDVWGVVATMLCPPVASNGLCADFERLRFKIEYRASELVRFEVLVFSSLCLSCPLPGRAMALLLMLKMAISLSYRVGVGRAQLLAMKGRATTANSALLRDSFAYLGNTTVDLRQAACTSP